MSDLIDSIKKSQVSLIDKIKLELKSKDEERKTQAKLNNLLVDLKRRDGMSRYVLDLGDILDKYQIIITDKTDDYPFIYAKQLTEVNKIARSVPTERGKAEAIYNWFEENVNYSESDVVGYRNSEEVYKERQGICGEMSYLYITLTRSIGLESQMVIVSKDDSGKKVNHACAAVIIDEEQILVDPAYHKFDIHHRKYQFLDDNQVTHLFRVWRHNNA